MALENTRFAFYAVIGTENVQVEESFQIVVEVMSDGQQIYFHKSDIICNLAGSDHVYLHYHGSHHSDQLKMDNLEVIFKVEGIYYLHVFFKSCGFHRYEEKAISFMEGVQLYKRCRDDDD